MLRVLDIDVNIQDSDLNANVKETLSGYVPGKVAVVAGSVEVAEKFLPSFEALQYPGENIVYIPV